jgi:hypothetical protein
MTAIKADIRELRDSRVEHYTLIASFAASQVKIDQLLVNTPCLNATWQGAPGRWNASSGVSIVQMHIRMVSKLPSGQWSVLRVKKNEFC